MLACGIVGFVFQTTGVIALATSKKIDSAELHKRIAENEKAIEKITGSWIIEIGELQAFNRSESNAIKRFITSQEDKTRLAYAHRTSYIKRQCVFAGTTNEQNFLKDKTLEFITHLLLPQVLLQQIITY